MTPLCKTNQNCWQKKKNQLTPRKIWRTSKEAKYNEILSQHFETSFEVLRDTIEIQRQNIEIWNQFRKISLSGLGTLGIRAYLVSLWPLFSTTVGKGLP